MKPTNGSNTSFWKDVWCTGGIRLMDAYPRLYALESQKDCMISDRWCLENGTWGVKWAWRSRPRGRALSDISSLLSAIGNLSLSPDGSDKWSWTLDASGKFKVKTLTKSIQNIMLADEALGEVHLWNSWIPRNGYSEKDEKQSQKRQNWARNGIV
ncbi:hypothetical protein Tco_1356941 [Tanacetum coccineum]